LLLSAASPACRSTYFQPVEPPRALSPEEQAKRKEEQKLENIIEAVKQYAYAYYDAVIGPSALPKPKERHSFFNNKDEIRLPDFMDIPPEEILDSRLRFAEKNLENVLQSYGLIPQELPEYFAGKGFRLIEFNVGTQNLKININLRKIIKKDEINIELWGTEYKGIKRHVLGASVIECFDIYRLRKQGNEIRGHAGASAPDYIEVYPERCKISAKVYYEGITENKSDIENWINNPDSMGVFLLNNKIDPEFFMKMGRLLRYEGVKQEFESSGSLEEFIEKFMKMREPQVTMEECQHLIDRQGINFNKYSGWRAEIFAHLVEVHTEFNALLARIYHLPLKNNKDPLGVCFAYVYEAKKTDRMVTDSHIIASGMVIEKYFDEITNNREKYPEISFKEYDANPFARDRYGYILKQFSKLTPEHIRDIAKIIYDTMYQNGKRSIEQVVEEIPFEMRIRGR